MSEPLLKYREPVMAQDILTEAVPARLYTEGSGLDLTRAVLFGVNLDKVGDIVELLRLYRGGRPNSLIMGGPMGWSWYSTLDTTHHGSLAGPANAHRHSDLASIGIDDHHARDHATRHHSGGADALALGLIAGNLTDAQHGSRTVANAHAHSHLSGIGANDHHNRSHDHSLAADGSPIAVAGVPDLPASKITSGTFPVARGGTGLSTIAAGGILYASALDTLSSIAPSAANQVLRSTAANALQIAALVAADIPSLDASKITSGRFGMPRMPAGDSGKGLVGKGAGVDPAYEYVTHAKAGGRNIWVQEAEPSAIATGDIWVKVPGL